MNGIFITGTDTGIGKTYFTLACIRSLQQAGLKVAAMKPIASGAEMVDGKLRNEDALQIQQALNHPIDYELINPYCFEPPVSPHIAAAQVGVTINLELIKQNFDALRKESDFVIVEGVGGWLAPLSENMTVVDLARAISLPVVMVVGIRLGCLNHASLTFNAIKHSGLEFAGWVANCIEPGMLNQQQQIDYITKLTGTVPLAISGWQEELDIELANLVRTPASLY